MRLLKSLAIHVGCASMLFALACASRSYYLVRTGIITTRSADSPAMLVADSGVSPRDACGHGAIVSFGPSTKVVNEDGTRADTSALRVGRKVSAFIGEDDVILQSCPPRAHATKLVLH